MAEKRIEMENKAKARSAKLPKLKIIPFKGTAADWVRFENMFITQVDSSLISDEEKFGYLLESVIPKVRDRIANLKPSSVGYKMAWDRLKKEYGQTKVVVNAHLDEIINLPTVRGTNHGKVQEFYDKLSNNYDALQTLGEGGKLQGFVMSTLNKLPHVKPDLVRVDDNWEEWEMEILISNLQAWLKRNKCEDGQKSPAYMSERRKKERSYYGGEGKPKPKCIFCSEEHWSDECKTTVTQAQRKKFFVDKNLCFNCGRSGHRGNQCRSRGCFKCGSKHHTSLCERNENLKPVVPVEIKGEVMWAYLDTGSAKNFVSRDAAKKLNLKPKRHEVREIVTLNGVTKQSMPIYEIEINALDGKARERMEVTGSKLSDFTTVNRPAISELKEKYEHMKNKTFYYTENGSCTIHLIIGDKTFSRMRTEAVCKGEEGDPVVEETSFGWLVHGGDDYTDDQCMFVRENSDCERLFRDVHPGD